MNNESGYVTRGDKDSFWRDERGLLSMSHLTSSLSSLSGVTLALAGLFAFFFTDIENSLQLIQIGAGLVGAAAGLEGWQTHVEGKNQRENIGGK